MKNTLTPDHTDTNWFLELLWLRVLCVGLFIFVLYVTNAIFGG